MVAQQPTSRIHCRSLDNYLQFTGYVAVVGFLDDGPQVQDKLTSTAGHKCKEELRYRVDRTLRRPERSRSNFYTHYRKGRTVCKAVGTHPRSSNVHPTLYQHVHC